MKFPRFLVLFSLLLAAHLFGQAAPVPPVAPLGREQTVYVPFDKLEDVFEKQERGVFLPYREFLELWNKLNLPEKLRDQAPPVEGVLASAYYGGKVSGEVADLRVKLNFEALKTGWSRLKLGASGLNVAESKSSALLNFADGGYEILFPDKGSYTMEARILGKITREQGRNNLRLRLPKTAVSQFDLIIPDHGLDFAITPASAFTAVENADGSTWLVVYFGSADEVNISWQKKAGQTALTPLLFAEASTDLRLSAGAVRTDVTVNYRILRAGVSGFDLTVPADQQVLSVEGQDVREWNLAAGPGGQKLHVELHAPARDHYTLALKLEAALPPLPQRIALPVVQAAGVERQSGTVSVGGEGEVVVEVAELNGLTQQAAAPQRDSRPGLVGQYRYLRLPFSGAVAVSEARPQVEVRSETLLEIEPDLQRLSGTFFYGVTKSGIFSTQIELPAGFTSAEAAGELVESATVAEVEGKRILTVKFSARRTGDFAFKVSAEAVRLKVDEPAVVPVFTVRDVARHEARVGLAIHVSLKANTTDKGDLREEDVQNLGNLAVRNPALTPLTLGFRYRGTAKAGQVQFELQKPRVSAEVFALMEVREAVIHSTWTVSYKVEFAGVNEFAIEVPKALAEDLRIDGLKIKERIRAEAKDAQGKATGAVLWRFVLQDKVLGSYALTLTHDTARGEVKPGAVAPVELPEIKPLGLFRETGQIAVLKDGNLEFTKTEPKGLEVIDPKELRGTLQRDGIFLAYKYAAHPIALGLAVSKNLYLEVPQAVVTYAVLTSVIAEDEAETTEVVYWVRNKSQQFFSIQLPAKAGQSAKLLSQAFVNGEPQQPSKRPDKNELLIRLPARQDGNAAFPVRFVYEMPSAHPGKRLGWRGSIKIEPPVLNDTEVLQTKWTLYLPADYRYVGVNGAMRESVPDRGWDRTWRRMRLFVPNVGPALPSGGLAATHEPPPLPPAARTGFDTQIPKEGVSRILRRLSAPAPVQIGYRGNTYAATLEALLAALAFFFGVRRLGSSNRARFAYFMVVGIGALIISGAVDPRAARPWQAIFVGVALSVVIWIVLGARGRWLDWRERRRAFRAQRPAAAATNRPPIPPPAPDAGAASNS